MNNETSVKLHELWWLYVAVKCYVQ